MYTPKGKSASELWAIINTDGEVMWSRGGSSTKAHLMVYPNEQAAKRGLNNVWTKQQIDAGEVRIGCIYTAQ